MKTFVFAVFLLLSSAVFGQGTLEVRENISVSGSIGKNVESTVLIKNTGTTSINIQIKRVETVIGSSQKTWFCINNDCQDPSVDTLPLSVKLEAGESFTGFKSVLTSGLSEGFSRIKYIVYDKNNPSNEVSFTVNYTIERKLDSKLIFNSPAITINDVYPNPVRDFAIIDYKINDLETNAKVIIHSVLGSILGEYTLQNMDNSIKIKTDTFNPGVYFYTLYIDNEGVMTRKIIVQK